MRPSIHLERRVVVTNRNDLLQVSWKKGRDGAGTLVLMHMPELMGEQPDGSMAMTNINAMTERQPHHTWAEEPGGDRGLPEIRVVWQRKMRNLGHANAIRVQDANAACQG